MKIGFRIKELRTDAGMSQEALAHKLSVDTETVEKWESEQEVPTLSDICSLKELFAVSFDNILTDGNASPKEKFTVQLTEKDLKSTDTMMYNKAKVNMAFSVLFLIVSATLLLLFNDGYYYTGNPGGFLLGIAVMFFLNWLRWFILMRKRRKKYAVMLPLKRTLYEIFEDYIVITLFENDVKHEVITVRRGDIEAVYSNKENTAFIVNNRIYTLRNDVVNSHTHLKNFLETAKAKHSASQIKCDTVSYALFAATILALYTAATLVALVENAGYSPIMFLWTAYLFVPVPLALIIFEIANRKKRRISKLNMIVGITVVIFLCCTGARSTNHFNNIPEINTIEDRISFDIPDTGKVSYSEAYPYTKSDEYYYYYKSIVTLNESGQKEMLNKIEADSRWKTDISDDMRDFLPESADIADCEYFMLYDESDKYRDTEPPKNNAYCCFLYYDEDSGKLFIDEYVKQFTQ